MDTREVNRYLELVDRRLFILVHSGIDWKPEYETELEAIDKELVGLRELVDQEHEKKGAHGRNQENQKLFILPQHDRPEPGGMGGMESPGL